MGMLAREATFSVIDFESTGSVEGFAVEPWQIGMVKVVDAKVSDEQWESLLRVGDRPFNPKAPGSHHKLKKALSEAPTLLECWENSFVVSVGSIFFSVVTVETLLGSPRPRGV